MPRGRPRLDPDVKTQNLAESRKHYEEKNIERRRETAKLRMQRKRAEIAASDNSTRRKYLGQAASNSERYRDRKHAQEREEQRAADAVIKKARTRKKVELRKKHKPLPKSPPPVAKPPPKLLPTIAKPPHRRRAPSPITPTPAPRRPATLVSNAHAAVGEHDNRSMDDESDEEHPIEAPIWPTRAHRPQRCPRCYQEDCVGCACLCSESDEWFDHPGGHYFPTCCGLVAAPAPFREAAAVTLPTSSAFSVRGAAISSPPAPTIPSKTGPWSTAAPKARTTFVRCNLERHFVGSGTSNAEPPPARTTSPRAHTSAPSPALAPDTPNHPD
ncbi:hypothetical protein B0H14DRAFT_3476487 [Mycena olivaceomarginata]|nr:hypothetical protein B0H14DRAFT_3476487 [Mycena olivaceomarginata]